jgi:hypothetical protein
MSTQREIRGQVLVVWVPRLANARLHLLPEAGATRTCPVRGNSKAIRHGHEHDELPFFGVARDMAAAKRILDEHDGPRIAPRHLAIARLEFHPSRQPDDQLPHRRRVPVRHAQPRGHPRETDSRGREPRRQTDRRDAGKELHGHKRDVDVSEVRRTALIRIDTKTLHGQFLPRPYGPTRCRTTAFGGERPNGMTTSPPLVRCNAMSGRAIVR